MTTPQDRPLTEDELAKDAHDSYYVAVTIIGERVRNGEPVPWWFRSMREEPTE